MVCRVHVVVQASGVLSWPAEVMPGVERQLSFPVSCLPESDPRCLNPVSRDTPLRSPEISGEFQSTSWLRTRRKNTDDFRGPHLFPFRCLCAGRRVARGNAPSGAREPGCRVCGVLWIVRADDRRPGDGRSGIRCASLSRPAQRPRHGGGLPLCGRSGQPRIRTVTFTRETVHGDRPLHAVTARGRNHRGKACQSAIHDCPDPDHHHD